jgi:hypothetical protein
MLEIRRKKKEVRKGKNRKEKEDEGRISIIDERRKKK